MTRGSAAGIGLGSSLKTQIFPSKMGARTSHKLSIKVLVLSITDRNSISKQLTRRSIDRRTGAYLQLMDDSAPKNANSTNFSPTLKMMRVWRPASGDNSKSKVGQQIISVSRSITSL